MNEDAKQSLKHKLAANHARREREQFLATLPPNLAARLQSARSVLPPESVAVTSHLRITEDGVGHPTRYIPAGYTYQAFSWPEPLLAAADLFPDRFDLQPAYLCLFDGLPLFCVSFGWARTHFRALFPLTSGGLAVITESLQVALVSSRYGGYLDGVLTDHETVYELAFWHPTANA